MMKGKLNAFTLYIFVTIFFVSCSEGEYYIPKPPTYLKINLPSNETKIITDSICGFSFTAPEYFSMHGVNAENCNKDIKFDQLNGVINLSVIKMDTTLSAYVNYAIDKVEEHKIKANAIQDTNFINHEHKTYGTFFELKGNVATPFQFYFTDSTNRFISGVVYFNTRPNYDSIKPVLEFVKSDLYQMVSSFEWID